MIILPRFNPTAIQFAFIKVQWYSLAYIFGLVVVYFGLKRISKQKPTLLPQDSLDDFIFYATLGIIIGGRLGYTLCYNFSYYIRHPIEILALWHGGMSFHGGLLGAVLAVYKFSQKYRLPFVQLLDHIVIFVPIGLGLGRLANFINQELYGRVTTMPWGMVFPDAGPLPRHPSQLYEAFLEGIVLLFMLQSLYHYSSAAQKPGCLTGLGLVSYAIFRIVAECFREPDLQLGFIVANITMGQILCLPMLAIGFYLLYQVHNKSIRKN